MPDVTRRHAAGGLISAMLATEGSAVPASAEPRTRGDPLWFVDPELRPAARAMQATPFPALSAQTLTAARHGILSLERPPLTTVPYTMRRIAGAKDAPAVTIYVINAKPGAKRGGILHTHGGGFVLGTAAAEIRYLQEIALALDCAIVTVDYRLAPETQFAGAIEDNYAGLRWLHDHAEEVGVHTARLAVMGGSAGGGHAALLAIAARDRKEVPLAFQCLVYPMLDDRTGSTHAAPAPIGTLLWTAEANRFGWRSFLGVEPGTSDVPRAAVPARLDDMSGLPPAWIGVGSVDLFVEEDIEYARRLINAGIMTELLVVPGAFHGFDRIAAETNVAKSFISAMIMALRNGLEVGASR